MDFCNAIKNIRNEHNLTQEELAAELHVTRQAISNWENEKNLPDIEMVIRIAKTFNVSLDEYIFGGKETMTLEEKLIKDGSAVQRQLSVVCVYLGYDGISTHSFRKWYAM